MLRRFLNIASIVCLVLCVALMGMWVRSYAARDMVRGVIGSDSLNMTSLRGEVAIAVVDWPVNPFPWIFESKSDGRNMISVFPSVIGKPPLSFLGFRWQFTSALAVIVLPYWFLALLCVLLAAASRVSWRFSLRTMLIATTLLAVVLGMIAWLGRAWIGK